MPSNLVHTYVDGNSFPNIFGGNTPCAFGQITHIEYMTQMMRQRWPWMQGKWVLSDGHGTLGYFDSLEEAQRAAVKKWPGCSFTTRESLVEEFECSD